jgi:uncharacterized protein (DUF433 family)
MNTLQEAEKLLSSMTREEKVQLLQRVTRDLGAEPVGIESTPDICGGVSCLVRTRIPVWALEQYRRQGASDTDLLRAYPTLRTQDLVNAWAYVSTHRDEIDQQIRENEAA